MVDVHVTMTMAMATVAMITTVNGVVHTGRGEDGRVVLCDTVVVRYTVRGRVVRVRYGAARGGTGRRWDWWDGVGKGTALHAVYKSSVFYMINNCSSCNISTRTNVRVEIFQLEQMFELKYFNSNICSN